MNLLLYILIILLQSSLILSQAIPSNHFLYHSRKLLYDAGEDWESLTVFGPERFRLHSQKILINADSYPQMDGMIGLDLWNDSFSLSGFNRFQYKNHYYGYIYPSFVSKTFNNDVSDVKPKLIHHKEDQYGLGFENNWAILQISRGKQSWGAGNDIQLAMSENSSVYDYFLLGSDYGKVRVRYMHGYLENVETNINRYITARGLELTNNRFMVVGFSEIVIYSGEDRLMDLGYLNPMSSHLEIELNNRLNVLGVNYSNAVWQIHMDYLPIENFRVSLNYLYDEFVMDQQIELEKEHGKALSLRVAYTPLSSSKHLFTLFSSLVYVGTPTFRHKIGTNNFVQNGRPLGWSRGSDGQEICVGMNYFNYKNLIFSFSTGLLQNGQESIINRVFEPYEDYLKGPFPSGKIDKIHYVETDIIYWWKEKYSISSAIYYQQNTDNIDLIISLEFLQKF